MKRMHHMLDEGTTLLFVSHSNKAVQEMCKNALWLGHDETQMLGSAAEVYDAYERKTRS